MKTTVSGKNTKAATGKLKTTSTSSFNEDKLSWIFVSIIILLVIFIRSKFLTIPFERDEGAYSYYGKLLLEGKIPYKDFYEQKFPGIFYFYAGIVWLFGDTVRGMHIGFMCLNVLTILLIYLAAKKLFAPFAGVISALTFAIVSLTPMLSGFTVQSEHGIAFFTSLGIFLYTMASDRKTWYWYLLMGLALGAAFMTKTTGLFIMLWGGLMLIIDFFFAQERIYKNLFKQVFLYMAGATTVVAILFFLIYLKGSFSDMIYWTYDIPKKYVNKVPFEEGVKYFGYTKDAILQNHFFFWAHAIAALVVCLIKPINYKLKLFAVTLAAFSAIMIVPGYYFYGHYWIQLIPGLSMLAGLTFYGITLFLKTKFNVTSPTVKYVYLSIFALITCAHLSKQKAYYFKPSYDRILRAVYGNNPFPETMEIANYINAHAKPEDQIVAMGSEPQLYFYTKKKCPSRHAYFAAIVDNVPEHKQWQREYVSGIEKAKPRYFVFYNHPISLFVQPNTDKYVFDWANKYISEHYKPIGVVDMIDNQIRANYVWDEAVNTYKPQAQNHIIVFERKD